MTDKEPNDMSLPRPPKTPFGGNRWSFDRESETQEALLAEKMAIAAAEGRLEGFMNSNIPDNEQARALAMMMLGMSGMSDFGNLGKDKLRDLENQTGHVKSAEPCSRLTDHGQDLGEGNPDVSSVLSKAAQEGDIHKLKELLKEEYFKRAGINQDKMHEASKQDELAQPSPEEKSLLERLNKIAYDNKTNVDWLMMRALRFYIQDYERTGRL